MKTFKNLIPKGWEEIKGTTTQPHGCIWICNGFALFEKDESGKRLYKSKILIIDKELFENRLKENQSYTQRFVKLHGKEIFYNL